MLTKFVSLPHILRLFSPGVFPFKNSLLFLPVYSLILYLSGTSIIDNPRVGILFICHSFYGGMWLFKDLLFPDKNFQIPCTLASVVIMITMLVSYYSPMFCLVYSDYCWGPVIFESPYWAFLGLLLWCVGVIFLYASDVQKYYQLKLNPVKLITQGFFRYSRHPNYFGEMLIYIAYGMMSGHAQSFYMVLWIWVAVFIPSIMNKEIRMSRYQQWATYKQTAWLLIPNFIQMLYDFPYIFTNYYEELNKIE